MQLVATDILADACTLSPALGAVTLVVGIALWLLGWSTHRFWVVLGATVLGGIYGLAQAEALRTPALAAAVLLALAAGMLALALVRLVSFVAAGLALVLVAHELWPGLNQPVVVFFVGGLLCLFLFPVCLMALTSFAGAVLGTSAVLMLMHSYAVVDAVAWAERSSVLLNWICGLLTVVGFTFQVVVHRWRVARARKEEEKDERGGWWLLGLSLPAPWAGFSDRNAA